MVAAPRALGHGAYHELIDRANQRVLQERGSDAYVSRGEIYRAHGDTDLALADYAKAAEIEPGLPALDLLRGRALLEGGRALAARPLLERYAEKHPEDARAFLYRARVRLAVGRSKDAATDYAAAFARMKTVSPDEYLERHRALVEAGLHEEALKGLDEGMQKLGPIVTLQTPAIELEVRAQRWDRALARLDVLAAQSPRKEGWHLRRGRILAQAGRRAEAREAFAAAEKALAALAPHLRNVPAMDQLKTEIEAALKELDRAAPGKRGAAKKARAAASR